MRRSRTPPPPGQTPSQTVGPFFHFCLPCRGAADLLEASDLGARPELFPPEHDRLHRPSGRERMTGRMIELTGLVLDGHGSPVPDALVETWQADGDGLHGQGFGRAATGEDGTWRLRTVRPGATPAPGGGLQAPHIAIGVLGRGLLRRLVTRVYFDDAPENAEDPVLRTVPPERRATLLAVGAGPRWRFDIILQGPGETVFFDV